MNCIGFAVMLLGFFTMQWWIIILGGIIVFCGEWGKIDRDKAKWEKSFWDKKMRGE